MKGKRFLAFALAAVMLTGQPVYQNAARAYAKETTDENREESREKTLSLYFGETNQDLLPMSREVFNQGISVEYTNPDICKMEDPTLVEHEGEYLWCQFELKQEGETDIQIYVGDHQLYYTYHVTSAYREQKVYLSMPTEISCTQPDVRIEIDDPTICSAEVLENPYNPWQNAVRITGLRKGITYVRAYTAWNSIEFVKKIEVMEAPDNIIEFEDENLRMALLGFGSTSFSADSDKDGYISQSDLNGFSYLPLQNSGIKSIRGLEYAQNLEWLYLDGNTELANIDPLFDLKNLEIVNLRNTAVSAEDQTRLRQFPTEMSVNKGNRDQIPVKVQVQGDIMPSVQVVSGQEAVDLDLGSFTVLAKKEGEAVIRISCGNYIQDIIIHVNGIDADQPLGEQSEKELIKVDSSGLLDSSLRLWQTYPEVKLERENVSQYVSGYVYTRWNSQSNKARYEYVIDKKGNLWSKEEKKADHIVAAQGRYALTEDHVLRDIYSENPADIESVAAWVEDTAFNWEENNAQGITYILKEDQTLWYRWEGEKDETPGKLVKISDDVTDMDNAEDGLYFLKENGDFCEYGYDWSAKEYGVSALDENAADLPKDGIYHSKDNETFVWDNYQQKYVNVGKKDVVKAVNTSLWNPEGYFERHEMYCLMGNGDVYRYIDGQEEQKIISGVKDILHANGENQKGTRCLYLGADGLYRTMEQLTGTQENPLDISERCDLWSYRLEDCGTAADYHLSRNGVVLLTHVRNAFEVYDENVEKNYVYVTRTDGTVWRIEQDGIPEKILDLNASAAVEMTDEKKQETVEQITAAEDKGMVSVDMESAVVLPKDVLEAAKEKEVTLECTLSDGTIWEIDGSALSSVESEKLADLDLSAERAGKENGAISSDKIDEIAGKHTAEQLNFTDGGSGISAALTLKTEIATEGKVSMKCVAVAPQNNGTQTQELLGVSLIADQKMKLALSKVTDCVLVYAVNGDISADGVVNITDLMQTLHHVSGRSEFNALDQGISDVDISGNTNITDLMKTLHFVSGRTERL